MPQEYPCREGFTHFAAHVSQKNICGGSDHFQTLARQTITSAPLICATAPRQCYKFTMSLTFGLSSVRDLFAKLKRDAIALEEEVTTDRFFNFVVTGYSMIDWIKNDPAVPLSAKGEVQTLYSDTWLRVCRDLANASKHFALTPSPRHPSPITADASSNRGWGIGRYGKGAFGVGEESIEIELNNGTRFQCTELVNGVISTWEAFFAGHGI